MNIEDLFYDPESWGTLGLRSELPQDFRAIDGVISQAFLGVKQSDGTEAQLVRALRLGPDYIKDLAMVIENEDENVIGFCMATKLTIDGRDGFLGLGPLAVHPLFQHMGGGSLLVNGICERASKLGYKAMVVFGDPAFYRRFGFKKAAPLKITAAFPGFEKHLLVHELCPGGLNGVTGEVRYAAPFYGL